MKKFLFALFSLAFIAAQAQNLTADEVIQKYAAAMGGLDSYNKLKTAKLTGTVTVQGMDLPITIQVINGKAMRTELDAMGQSIINVYKDGTGWKINPLAGAATATDVTGAELSEFKSQSMLANQLMDYKKRGYTAELGGQEDVNGVKSYKVKLTNDEKKETTYFINSTDFSLLKSVSKRNMMGQDVEVETYYSDLKDFGGVKWAMSRTQQVDGQVFQSIKIDKVEVDIPIDEKIFDKQ